MNCSICGKNLGVISLKARIEDGIVCRECLLKANLGNLLISDARQYTVEDIRQAKCNSGATDEQGNAKKQRYCFKCHNSIPHNMAFCPQCGIRQKKDINHTCNIKKFIGKSIKSKYGRTLELLESGIHIFEEQVFFVKGFDKLIPYDDIKSVSFVKSGLISGSGYISIITGNAGFVGDGRPLANKMIHDVNTDRNTIIYKEGNDKLVENIYLAINDICLAGNISEQRCNNIEINDMNGHEFEYYCASLLESNGFIDVIVTKGSGDQGVDILAKKGGVKYAFQCKKHASPLTNTCVQEVNSGKAFYNCHVGIVLTDSSFTKSAIELAEATGVLLWGYKELQELIEGQKKT